MTNFNTPITTPQYAKLRSGHAAADYLLTLCKNTVVFSGTLSLATTGQASWHFITYGTHTGNWTDIEPNMAILFSTVNDIKTAQNNRYRIRYDVPSNSCASPTTINVSESSQDFPVGTYFWVIYTFDIVPRLSYFGLGGELVDFSIPFQADPPIAPTLRTAYVGDCDAVTGKMRVAFDVSDAYSSAYGRTVTGFAWTFKAGTDTVISGSKATAIVTIDFAPGEQWGKLLMTDSGGLTWERRFYIHAHDDNNPYDTGFEKIILSDTLQQGWTCRAPAFDGVDDVLSKTFGVITRGMELYNYSEYHLDTNNVAFVGWVQREDDNLTPDPTYSLITDASFQLNGIGAMLARAAAQEIGVGFSEGISIGAWGYNAHSTPWRAIIHYLAYYTTALFLAGFDADLKDETFLYPSIAMTGSNAFDIITILAKAINAGIFFAPDGRFRLDTDAAHWNAARRAAATPVATFTSSDGLPVSYSNDLGSYGLVDADGLFYNTVSQQITPFKVRAPGVAMGEAQNRGSLTQQILAATTDTNAARNELIQRANDELEALNISEVLTWKFPDGYNFLIASRGQVFAFIIADNIAGPNGVNRVVYDGTERFLCESVTETLLGNGAIDITGTFRRLSRIGDSTGLDMTPGPDTNIDITVPDITVPAFDWEWPEFTWPDDGSGTAPVPDPPPGRVAWFNGSEAIVYTSTKVYFVRKINSPNNKLLAIDITPSDLGTYLITSVVLDPYYTTIAIPLFLLASDGTNSAIWNCPNGAIRAPAWTKGTPVTGYYNEMRSTPTRDSVMIATGTGTPPTSTVYNFLMSTAGWQKAGTGYTYEPHWVAGSGWHEGLYQSAFASGRFVLIGITLPAPTTITKVKVYYDVDLIMPVVGGDVLWGDGGSIIAQRDSVNGTGVWTWTGSITTTEFQVTMHASQVNDGSDPGGTVIVPRIEINSTDGSPTSVNVRVSTDRGLTIGSAIAVGSDPAALAIGFDVQRSAANSIVAGNEALYRAATIGGAYSSWWTTTGGAQIVCAIFPYFNWAGTKQTDATNPDVIVALDRLDGSSRSLIWIEGGGTPGTEHDLTPVAGIVFDNPNCVTISYSHHIAVFGLVSGSYALYRTANKGTTWTLVKALGQPKFIRCRRDDNRAAVSASNKGQLYLADGNLWFSSDWAHTGPYERLAPGSPLIGLETIF